MTTASRHPVKVKGIASHARSLGLDNIRRNINYVYIFVVPRRMANFGLQNMEMTGVPNRWRFLQDITQYLLVLDVDY